MLNNDLLERLKQSKDDRENNLVKNDFGFKSIHGDTGVYLVPLSELSEAPNEWNFYSPLNNQKMKELIDSILDKGLLHPIVVWQKTENTYMILSGHNRVKAYSYIYEATKDDKYLKIPALIKKENEITENEAKEIIVDTNWVQRILSPLEKSKSIARKYYILQKQSRSGKKGDHQKGKVRDVIAEQYKISGRLIEEYRRISNLIDPLINMLDNHEISITAASKLALFNHDMQQWILEKYRDLLTSKYVRKLNSTMSQEDIENVFQNNIENTTTETTISLKVTPETASLFSSLSEKQKGEIAEKLASLIDESMHTIK